MFDYVAKLVRWIWVQLGGRIAAASAFRLVCCKKKEAILVVLSLGFLPFPRFKRTGGDITEIAPFALISVPLERVARNGAHGGGFINRFHFLLPPKPGQMV